MSRRRKDGTLALAVPEIGGVLELRGLVKGIQATGVELGDLSFAKNLVQDLARLCEDPQSQPRLPLSTWLEQAQVQVGPIAAQVLPRVGAGPQQAMLLPPFHGLAAGTGRDLLVNAGGPVYGLDCLLAQGGAVVYAAIGVSSLAAAASSLSDLDLMRGAEGAPRLHVVGERSTTPNLVQIWRMPPGFSGSQPGAEGCAMTFAIGHRLGPVWDLRWAPNDALLYDDNGNRGTGGSHSVASSFNLFTRTRLTPICFLSCSAAPPGLAGRGDGRWPAAHLRCARAICSRRSGC